MTRLRTQISILLMAVLVLTGHSMAIARGMPVAAGVIELCTGTGPVMTPVDTEGNPTGPAHICPEFSLSLLDALDPDLVSAVPLAMRGQRIAETYLTAILVIRPVASYARGPPSTV